MKIIVSPVDYNHDETAIIFYCRAKDREDYMRVYGIFDTEQFEIIGLAAGNIRGLAGIPSRTGKDGPYIDGKLRYGRIFIKRKM